MTNSILTSVKRKCNISEENIDFDDEIIDHINSVFTILNQLGVGPVEGFSISDASSTWTDFTEDRKELNSVKSYIGSKVKLSFDPPTSSAHMEALKANISEFEWRLNVTVDPGEIQNG